MHVTGTLVGVPIIGNVGLGTLFTLAPQTLSFASALPGFATLADLQGGLPPFPNDMLANFAAALPFTIPVPLNLPIAVNQTATIPNGQSGFSSLQINGNIAATLNLSNIGYNVSGTVPNVLVPEPGSLTLASLGVIGLVGLRGVAASKAILDAIRVMIDLRSSGSASVLDAEPSFGPRSAPAWEGQSGPGDSSTRLIRATKLKELLAA